ERLGVVVVDQLEGGAGLEGVPRLEDQGVASGRRLRTDVEQLVAHASSWMAGAISHVLFRVNQETTPCADRRLRHSVTSTTTPSDGWLNSSRRWLTSIRHSPAP